MKSDNVEYYWAIQMKLIGSEEFVDFYEVLEPEHVGAVLSVTLKYLSRTNEEVRVVRRVRV
jgi:hypothetical protein